jgi:hypothetical protein
LSTTKTTTYDVGNPGPGLGHAHGTVKPVNEITSVLQRQNIYKQTLKEPCKIFTNVIFISLCVQSLILSKMSQLMFPLFILNRLNYTLLCNARVWHLIETPLKELYNPHSPNIDPFNERKITTRLKKRACRHLNLYLPCKSIEEISRQVLKQYLN